MAAQNQQFSLMNIRMTGEYTSRSFDDAGTGASKDCSLWQPKGKYWFGHIFSDRGYSEPSAVTAVVDSFSGDMLAPPVSFEKIWTDAGTGASHDRSLWRPVPPRGYVALGNVGVGRKGNSFSNSKKLTPSNEYVKGLMCVRKDLVKVHSTSDLDCKWTDAGSGAKKDAAVFNLRVGEGYVFSFAGQGKNDKPTPYSLIQLSVGTIKLKIEPICLFYCEGNSKGTFVKKLKHTTGFSRSSEFSTEFQIAMEASISGPLSSFTGSLSSSMSSSIKSSTTSSYQEEKVYEEEITVNLSKPMYIYAMQVSGRFRSKPFSTMGNIFITSKRL